MLTELEQVKYYKIYKRYMGHIYHFIMGYVKDPEIAEEYTIRILLKLYSKDAISRMQTIHGRETKTYIAKVTVDMCFDEFVEPRRRDGMMESIKGKLSF